jgi:Polysaccharide deacetylase
MRSRLAAAWLLVLALAATTVPAGVAAVGQPSGARAGVVRGTTWLLRNDLSGGPAQVSLDFGLAGDDKVMGDWNGDGTRTPGVFRDGTWYLRDRNGAGGRYVSFPFGAAGDRPVVGDWNRDGLDTIGIFRAGAWHLRDTVGGGGPDRLFAYGRQPGDVLAVWKQVRTTVPPGLEGTEWTRLPTTRNVVAPTIDAGGIADGLPGIVDTLRRHGVAATFFVTGQFVERLPQQTREVGPTSRSGTTPTPTRARRR